jgi:hypothetical protein
MFAFASDEDWLESRRHRGVAQFGSAFGWGPKGRWFKSSRPDSTRTSVRLRQVPPIPLGDGMIAIPIVLVAMIIDHA